jgi:rare lipoprotein A
MSDIYKNILLIMFLVLALTDVKINSQGGVGAKNTKEEVGVASFYTVKSSGTITANGEKYNEQAFTCASNDCPFNTVLRISNISNSKSVLCRVNDRGGFKKYGRILDLSPRAFKSIAPLSQGLVRVKVEVIK